MELLLVGLAGCTAMDVISILRKKRQEVRGYTVAMSGVRTVELAIAGDRRRSGGEWVGRHAYVAAALGGRWSCHGVRPGHDPPAIVRPTTCAMS